MADDVERRTLSEGAARQLANATKTHAQWGGITPRWLVNFLSWTPVEAGIFRLNRVKERGDDATDVECSPPRDSNPDLPETFVDYVDNPREYFLKAVTTVLDVQTRVSDLYSQPFDQVQEQLRLLIEKVKERQEGELINNGEYGLLASVSPSQRIRTRKGPPTPDDLDELLTKVWKEPGFFLAHPRAIAAFGRECTRRGVPPPTVTLFGTPFITWRGCRSCLRTRSRSRLARRAPRRPRSSLYAPAKRSRALSGYFSPAFRAKSPRAFRSASWASIARPSPHISFRSIARSPC
jgi:hypothetical protein